MEIKKYITLNNSHEITWVGTHRELLELTESEYINTYQERYFLFVSDLEKFKQSNDYQLSANAREYLKKKYICFRNKIDNSIDILETNKSSVYANQFREFTNIDKDSFCTEELYQFEWWYRITYLDAQKNGGKYLYLIENNK